MIPHLLCVVKKYEDRFIAEYVQLMIRYGNLLDTVMSYHDEPSDFISDIEDLEEQIVIMKKYIDILQKRAKKRRNRLTKNLNERII